MACKAAVKAGDVLTNTQMHQLLEDLSGIETDLPARTADQPVGQFLYTSWKRSLNGKINP